jgi:hypothetical protein
VDHGCRLDRAMLQAGRAKAAVEKWHLLDAGWHPRFLVYPYMPGLTRPRCLSDTNLTIPPDVEIPLHVLARGRSCQERGFLPYEVWIPHCSGARGRTSQGCLPCHTARRDVDGTALCLLGCASQAASSQGLPVTKARYARLTCTTYHNQGAPADIKYDSGNNEPKRGFGHIAVVRNLLQFSSVCC